jgi:hypothetical protein
MDFHYAKHSVCCVKAYVGKVEGAKSVYGEYFDYSSREAVGAQVISIFRDSSS